ncbi:LTA synthase family protein [Candidatus Gracilibacteria bacterium]|nr:LTA synthase family protein [Candidatus Gracilibacteria bacterium]
MEKISRRSLLGRKIPAGNGKKYAVIFGKVLVFLLIPFLLALLLEFIQKGSIELVFNLIKNNPVVFLFSYFITLLLFASFFFIIGPNLGVGIFFITFFIFSLINHFKVIILGEPFYPVDIFVNAGSSKELFSFIKPGSEIYLIYSFLFLILIFAVHFLVFRKTKISRKIRIILLLLLIPSNYYIFASEDFRVYELQKLTGLNVEGLSWQQKYNYDNNGFVVGFYTNLGNIFIKKPDNYNKEEIQNILSKIPETTNLGENKVKPDIIFILSEAFWDVTKLQNIEFSENPLKNFDSLKKDFSNGFLLSPTYGGKTAMVEYEILTGNLVKYLPFGSIAYQQYINKPIPSIVWELKNNGYSTLAIHTYEKSFFNREKTYPLLGFDKFIGLEDMAGAWYKGPFISDKEFTEEIIENYDKKSDNPKFIFGISMENHFPYNWEKFKKNELDIEVTKSNLTEASKQIVTNYAQGIKDADKQLKRLIDHIKASKKPTIVAFFGDHLGALGDNYFTYKETGFVSSDDETKWSKDELLKIYSTPYLIWDNIGLKKDDKKYIGSAFFGNYILDTLNIKKKSRYFDYVSYIYNNCIVGNSKKLIMDKNYQMIENMSSLKEECKNIDTVNYKLQYDILFGENYIKK